MKRPTNTEIILGLLLFANLLFSIWLYQTIQRQDDRIKNLERNDKVIQSVKNLENKVDSIKDRVQGWFE
jgi:peptidoglycan hydrolase CwlO-like protein